MEQSAEASQTSGREASVCGLHSKRLKELENAALQTTLTSEMDTEPPAEPPAEQSPGPEEPLSGLSLSREAAEQEPDPGRCVKQLQEEQRSLTDHLNKRLLSSFLDKLNERDLALPGVRHLDCAVAEDEEDSNRAAEDW